MKMHDKLINFLAENKKQAAVNDKGEAIGFSDTGNQLIYLNTEKKGCAIPSVIAEHDETWTLLHRDDLKMLNNKNETPRNTGKLELGEILWLKKLLEYGLRMFTQRGDR